jgi:hypothetical protein
VHPRYTGDLDFFVNPSEENASRLISVLDDFGFANLGLGHSDFVEGDQIIQLGHSPNRIDLLTGITFEEAWETKLSAEIDGLPFFITSKEAFAENKRAIGRTARSRGHCFSRTGRDETKLSMRPGLVFTSPPDAG